MTRLLALVVFVALAAGTVSAQEVVLGGWTLPEGAVLTTTVREEGDAVMTFRVLGVPDSMRSFASTDAATRDVVYGVEGGRPVEMRYTILREAHHQDLSRLGRVVQRTDTEGPLVGLALRAVLHGDEWTHEALDATLTPEQEAALADRSGSGSYDYPEHAVHVGQTWDVDHAALTALYGDLDPDHPNRLTLRLDSLGRYEGVDVAYISRNCDVVTLEEGLRMEMRLEGRVIRRLDWKVDVLTTWEGALRAEGSTEIGLIVRDGTWRLGTRTDVALPDEE